MKCKACGGAYRTGRVALVVSNVSADGKTISMGGSAAGRVCPTCAKTGTLIVARRSAIVEREAAKGPPASAEVLRTLKAQLRGLRAAWEGARNRDSFIDGRIEGLENAIDALEGKS